MVDEMDEGCNLIKVKILFSLKPSLLPERDYSLVSTNSFKNECQQVQTCPNELQSDTHEYCCSEYNRT